MAGHISGITESMELAHGDSPDLGSGPLPGVSRSDLITVATDSTNSSVNPERFTNFYAEVAGITQDSPTFHLALLGWEDPLQLVDYDNAEATAGTVVEDASVGVSPWVNPTNAQGASNSVDATAIAGAAEGLGI